MQKKRMQLRQEANEKIADMVKKETQDTLNKVLYELSNQMKNAYPDQTHKERLYLDINLQLMQKNLPEIKWLIVLLVKEVKKYFKSEKEEIEQSEVICGGGLL